MISIFKKTRTACSRFASYGAYGVLLFFPAALLAVSGATTITNPLGQGTTISKAIVNITQFIFQLGTAIAAIVFIVGGFQYLFSFGSEQKIEQAKKTLWYGIIGLVVMLLAQSVAGFIKNLIG